MAKGATSKKKREDEKRQEPQQREGTRQRQQRTQREPSQNNSASSRQTTRREVAPAAIPVLEERSTPRMSASGRNVASMFPESTAPQTTNIPKVEPIQANNNSQGFASDVDSRVQRRNEQGIRFDAEERIKASDASQYGTEREETTSMPVGTDMAEKGRKMAQRRSDRDTQNITMPFGRNGDYQGEGGGRSFEKESNLSDIGQQTVDDINKKIDRLSVIPTGTLGAVDQKMSELYDEADTIRALDNLSTNEKVDYLLDPDHRMSKSEQDYAKSLFDEYIENNSKAKELYNTNDATMSSLLAQRFTPEEAEEYARMVTLKNKTSNLSSAGLHMVESMPFVKGLADKSTEKYGEQIGKDLSDYNYSNQLEQTQRQNPLASTAGNMGYQLGSYAAFAPLVEGIPVVGKAASALGGKFSNPAVAKAVESIVSGQAADTILDTLPNEIIPDLMEGNWRDLPKDIALNQLGNLAFNVAGEGVGALARNFIPSLRQTDEVADAVKQNELDPADLARQNEIDVNAKVDDVNQAVDEINRLDEQIPEAPTQPIEQAVRNTPDVENSASNIIPATTRENYVPHSRQGEAPAFDMPEYRADYSKGIAENVKSLEMPNDVRGYVDSKVKTLDDIFDRIDNAQTKEELDGLYKELNDTVKDLDDTLKDSAQARLIPKRTFDDNTKSFVNAIKGMTINVPDNVRAELPNQTLKQLETRLHFYGDGQNINVHLRKNSGIGIDSVFEDIDAATGHALSSFMEQNGLNPDVTENQLKGILEYADYLKETQNSTKVMDYTGGIFDDYVLEAKRRLNARLQAINNFNAQKAVNNASTTTAENALTTPDNANEIPTVNASELQNTSPDIPRVDEPPTRRINEENLKTSETYTNTGRRGGGWDEAEYNEYTDPEYYQYESISEKQSVDEAAQMRNTEGRQAFKDRVLNKDHISSIELDGLMMEWRETVAEARALEAAGEDASLLWNDSNIIFKKIQEQSTSNAQALQALAKWSRNTPEGMLMNAENIINKKLPTDQTALKKALDKITKNHKDIEFSPEFQKDFLGLAEQLQNLDPNSREAKDIVAQLGRMISKELPVKLPEKITSLLMDDMLGNFRTLITRNAGGNLGLNVMEQTMTRPLAAALDRLVSNKTGIRTQAGMTKEGLQEYISGFAKGLSDEVHDLKTGLHTARTGENTLENAVSSNRHVFKSKVMDKLDSLVKNGLSVGDRTFYEATYKQTLGDYNRLRATGQMGETIQNLSDEQFKEYAETAARLNALSAVYQNDSVLSGALLKFKDAIGDLSEGTLGVDVLSQFSMPFVKTPANVVDRAIDYSPLGIIRNTARTIREGGIGGENFDQNRFVNETARNILGTTLMGGGVAAAKNGIISGGYSDDPDEKKAQKDSGMQEYALNLPEDKQMDISWIPVLGSNAVAAAAGYDAYNKNKEAPGLAIEKGVEEGVQALFDQSMFQGLQRLFGTGESYDSDSTIFGNMANVVKSGLGQLIPSLLRQTAQVTDPYVRDIAYSNKDVSFGTMDNYDLNSLANNIPGLREAVLSPKVDSRGNLIMESQGRGIGSKILEDMILPGKITQLSSNALNDEAQRLSDVTRNKTSWMPKPDRKSVDTEEHSLTNEEWQEYQQTYGSEMTTAGETLINTPLYQQLSDSGKETALSELYSAVRSSINSDYNGKELTGAAKEYKENGLDAAMDYILYGNMVKDYELDNNEKNREIAKTGGAQALQEASQAKKFREEAGVDSNSKVGELINDAVASGDTAQAQQIVDNTVTLQSLGLDKPGPAYTYDHAQSIIPGLTVEQFAETYQSIDADGNQGIKQGEIIDYLNANNISSIEGGRLWNAYGNSTWKKIPVLGDDGVWSLKSK